MSREPDHDFRDLFWPCLLFLVVGMAFFGAAFFVR